MFVYKVDVFDYSLGSDCPKLVCSFLNDSTFDDLSVLNINSETYVYTLLGVTYNEKNPDHDYISTISYADFINSRVCNRL